MNRFSMETLLRRTCGLGVAVLFFATVTPFWAQEPAYGPPQSDPTQPQQTQPQQQPLSPQQLDNLVAPVALYPDPMLGQVLAAATYPLEVVEAQQWLQAHSNLRGQQLTDAARQQNWDPSIQAMVAFPDVLAKLNQDVQWTTALGNAFLSQQSDVMAAVQRMRARAQANGRLSSNQQETVATDTQNGQQAITIQPANPEVIYVPSYDPAYIWGPPVYGYYPPLYYPAFGYGWGPGINVGFFFGGWGGLGFGWGGWGWMPSWYGGGLFLNAGFFNHYGYGLGGVYGGRFGAGYAGRVAWAHDAAHRMGVPYSNARLAGRYQSASMASRMAATSRLNSASRMNSTGYANRSVGSETRGGEGYRSFGNGSSYRSAAPQQSMRNSYNNSQYRSSAPQQRGYSAPAQNYRSAPQSNAGRSYSSGATRSYSSGGGASRSYSSGGGASRSYSSGGGGHYGGGGGGHSGGGHGGRR
jgi:hypothetical protein